MSEAPRTFTAHLRMNPAHPFTVTVTGTEVTLPPGLFIVEGHYWLLDGENKRIGCFQSYGGVAGPADFRTTDELWEAMKAKEITSPPSRLTHSQRLDQRIRKLEDLISILEHRTSDVFTRPDSIFYGQTYELVRQRFDEEIAKLRVQGIERLLGGLFAAPDETLAYWGLRDNDDIRRKISRIERLYSWQQLHPVPSPS